MKDVPVVWLCKKIKIVVRVGSGVVCSNDGELICDCGVFVSHSDELHKVMQFGEIDCISELDFLFDRSKSKLDVNGKCDCLLGECHCEQKPLVLPVYGVRCSECGKVFYEVLSRKYANDDLLIYKRVIANETGDVVVMPVIRSINGVWVCYRCYGYQPLDNRRYAF